MKKIKLIGREEEQATLQAFYDSSYPEFMAIYGRRRIGKTFLVNQFFADKRCVFFKVTGIQDGDLEQQVARFMLEVSAVFYHNAPLKSERNWFDAFDALNHAINKFVVGNKKIVLFFDEFPWMVTHRSKLLTALEYFWNHYWCNNPKIKLIICGSSASWIINKIIDNKGGLHNRITRKLQLTPFKLDETRKFLLSKGIRLTHRQVTQLYMVTGGIPYYLFPLEKGLSATQLVEMLAFRKNSLLFREFDNLFSSLFDEPEIYIELVRVIAKHRYGLDQESIIDACQYSSRGGRANDRLKQLEEAGFVISFLPFDKKKGLYYRVIDEYVLFYLNWIEPIRKTLQKTSMEAGYWEKLSQSPAWAAWAGYAFESICYKHLSQIRKKLKISPDAIANAWHYLPKAGSEEKGAQVDLLFNRSDEAITLCEIKYTDKPFAINKQYAKNLLNKQDVFLKKTKTKKQIIMTLVTAAGLRKNLYSDDLIDGVVVLDDLFS